MEKTINITGHSTEEFDFGIKHIVSDGSLKYQFFETRKDGNSTKAYEQWAKRGLGVGRMVSAEVAEEAKSFFDPKTGKDVKFTRRTILYFKGDEPEDSADMEMPEGLPDELLINGIKYLKERR